MTVRGLASSALKSYCITYHAKVQNDEYTRRVTVRQKFPPTGYRAFTAARNDFQQFARNMGSIEFVNVTNVSFGPCEGSSGGGGGSGPVNPPDPPVLSASADEDSIFLDWNAVISANTYNVKRSTVQGGPYTTIATGVTATDYDDTTAVVGTIYYYVVSAVNGVGEGNNSNEASAQILETTGWLMADEDTFSDVAGTVPSVNGGSVECWKDQGPDGLDVTWPAVGGSPPTLVTNALNGLPIVRWVAGTTDDLQNLAGSFSQPITIIVVLKFTNTLVTIIYGPVVRGGLAFGRRTDNLHVGIFSGGITNSNIIVDGGVQLNGTFGILTYVANGANSYIRVNGVQVVSGNAGSAGMSGLFIGENTSGADVAEIMRLTGAVPTQQYIDDQEAYLAAKWGISI